VPFRVWTFLWSSCVLRVNGGVFGLYRMGIVVSVCVAGERKRVNIRTRIGMLMVVLGRGFRRRASI